MAESARPGCPAARVLHHHVHDGGNLIQPKLDPLWREVIFSSKLGKQLGEDDLMLQWLYLARVLQPQAPGFKSNLKSLIPKMTAAVRALFKPSYRDRGDGARDNAPQGKQSVDGGRIEGHWQCASRIDGDIIRTWPRPDPANTTDVVW